MQKQLVEVVHTKATLLPQTSENSRPKLFPWWVEMYVLAVVALYPTMYLREIQETVADDLNLLPVDTPSLSTISQMVLTSEITRKKCTEVALERFSPHVQLRRREFVQWRKTVDPRNLYFFDESSFASDADLRPYGRCESGYALPLFQGKSRSASHSVIWRGRFSCVACYWGKLQYLTRQRCHTTSSITASP